MADAIAGYPFRVPSEPKGPAGSGRLGDPEDVMTLRQRIRTVELWGTLIVYEKFSDLSRGNTREPGSYPSAPLLGTLQSNTHIGEGNIEYFVHVLGQTILRSVPGAMVESDGKLCLGVLYDCLYIAGQLASPRMDDQDSPQRSPPEGSS